MGFRLALDDAGVEAHKLEFVLTPEPVAEEFLLLFDTLKVDKSLVSPGGFKSKKPPDEEAIRSLVSRVSQREHDSGEQTGSGAKSRRPSIVCEA
eukprot:124523-Prymnesium_polylepis.1